MNTYFDPSAPLLIGLVGYESGGLAASISRGGYQNLWYNPSPTLGEVAAVADPRRVTKLTEEGGHDAAKEYLNQVADNLAYPVVWDHISMNAPIHEAFKARVGTAGEGARNRILYQILMAMQDLCSQVPNIDFEDFIELVRKISMAPMSLDGDITPNMIDQVRDWVTAISSEKDNHLINRTKRRLREKRGDFDRTIEEQYNLKTETLEESDPSLNQLPRVQALIVTEILTDAEADFIKAHTNGILIGVNTTPPDLDESKIDGRISSALELHTLGKEFVRGRSVEGLFLKDGYAQDQ